MATQSLTIRAARELTADQFYNLGERVRDALLAPKGGLPAADLSGRTLAEQIGVETMHLGLRMRLESKSQFTKDNNREEKLRDAYVVSIRKGITAILTDKDPALPPARRQAAELLRDLVAKRPKRFETMANGENTTQLEFLFVDFDTAAAQTALREADLLRYYQPLKQAHAAYIALVAEEEKAEAAAAVALPTENPRKLPELRAIKETLAAHLRLAFDLIAFMANQGIAPDGELSIRCSAILSEAGLVAKVRETRAKKAAKQATLPA
jgi:hypothetical protein